MQDQSEDHTPPFTDEDGEAFFPLRNHLRILTVGSVTAVFRRCSEERRCQSAERKSDLEALHKLLEAGKVTPVVDRTFPLIDVREAIRYLRAGRIRGKIVITV